MINRLPPWPGKEKLPFEILYHEKPNVNYFRVFGSTCYVYIPKANRTKFDPKGKKCIFVGHDSCGKGWRCMDLTTKKFITSRDVVFDEVSSFCGSQKCVVMDVFSEDVVSDSAEVPLEQSCKSTASVEDISTERRSSREKKAAKLSQRL